MPGILVNESNLINEINRLSMKRNVSFWKREMNEEILAEFGAEGEVTLSPTRTKFIENASRNFIVMLFFIYEGADFLVSMRGSTQAFYDLIDNPKELKILYDIGRETGIEVFEIKREIKLKY